MSLELTAVYLKAPEGGYVAFVEESPRRKYPKRDD